MQQSKPLAEQLQTAIELHQLGRLHEAQDRYRLILEQQPAHADALHLLAVTFIQSAEAHLALPLLEQAIALNGAEASYHSSLGRAHHVLSDYELAIAPLRQAAKLSPGDVESWCDLGATLQSGRHVDEAVEIYQHALRVDPNHTTSRYNLATALHDQGDLSQAVELLKGLISENPQSPSLHSTLAGYLLEQGALAGALAESDITLSLNARALMAMTFKSTALLRLGDRRAARELVDFDRLITCQKITVPSRYSNLEEFNSTLVQHAQNHPTLVHERRQNATRHGGHTSNLLISEKGPMADLETIFNNSVRDYLQQLPQDPTHPYLKTRPPAWDLQAWAVVMDAQGHQLAHTHPEGWVSGVYYAQVPDVVSANDPQQAGWIEFGRPLPELLGDAEPDTQRYQPEAGLLVLFPSYFYHETVPFEAPTRRVSFAFDAIPKARG